MFECPFPNTLLSGNGQLLFVPLLIIVSYEFYIIVNCKIRLWFDDFGIHFLVVSAIAYIIILCTVLIGTAIPAWRICRFEITKSLRDQG